MSLDDLMLNLKGGAGSGNHGHGGRPGKRGGSVAKGGGGGSSIPSGGNRSKLPPDWQKRGRKIVKGSTNIAQAASEVKREFAKVLGKGFSKKLSSSIEQDSEDGRFVLKYGGNSVAHSLEKSSLNSLKSAIAKNEYYD